MYFGPKPTSRGMLLDICSMRSQALKLLELNSDFSKLLLAITEKDYYNEDLALPSIKDLAQQSGQNYNTTRDQLKKIHTQLCSDAWQHDHPFEFKNQNIVMYLDGYYNKAVFTVKDLVVLPRKGETIMVPFFQALTNCTQFYVDEVCYEFNDNKLEIALFLQMGTFNRYWAMRKDQAFELGEFSLHDIGKSDNDLKRMLDSKPNKAW